jgi:hypothetical protein
MVAGWSTTNRSRPCALSSVMRARSLVSSFGSALLYRRFDGLYLRRRQRRRRRSRVVGFFASKCLCRLSWLACNIGGKSRHPRYGRPQDVPGRAPSISDHQPPTRPGDNTPRIMAATGGENHAGPSWPNPQLSRSEDSNGGRRKRPTATTGFDVRVLSTYAGRPSPPAVPGVGRGPEHSPAFRCQLRLITCLPR